MASAVGAISGGHFNPSVTIGLWSAQKINTKNAIGYIVAQCLGAISAAFLLKGALPASVLTAVHMGTPALAGGISHKMGLVTEFILTFFLVFVIYGTAVDSRAPKCGGLFIGLAVAMGVLMGGPLTGAAMNPARHLGPALLGGGLQDLWLYWVGPVLGAVFAAQVYKTQLEK